MNNENTNSAATEGRKIEIHSLGPISPGGTGMLAFKMNGTADLIGIELEEGTEAIRLLASKLDLNSEVFPLIEVLENIKIKEGPIKLRGTVTLLAKNNTDVAKNMTGFLHVKNEEAAEVEVISANGKKIPQSVVNHSPRKIQNKVTAENRGILRNLGVPAGKHVTKPVFHMVLPKDGEHVVIMAQGHCMSVIRYLKFKSKLHPSFGPSILKQLFTGMRRKGAVSFGGNEVAIVLQNEQIVKLYSAVSNKYNHMSTEDTEVIIAALQTALDRKQGSLDVNLEYLCVKERPLLASINSSSTEQ